MATAPLAAARHLQGSSEPWREVIMASGDQFGKCNFLENGAGQEEGGGRERRRQPPSWAGPQSAEVVSRAREPISG